MGNFWWKARGDLAHINEITDRLGYFLELFWNEALKVFFFWMLTLCCCLLHSVDYMDCCTESGSISNIFNVLLLYQSAPRRVRPKTPVSIFLLWRASKFYTRQDFLWHTYIPLAYIFIHFFKQVQPVIPCEMDPVFTPEGVIFCVKKTSSKWCRPTYKKKNDMLKIPTCHFTYKIVLLHTY